MRVEKSTNHCLLKRRATNIAPPTTATAGMPKPSSGAGPTSASAGVAAMTSPRIPSITRICNPCRISPSGDFNTEFRGPQEARPTHVGGPAGFSDRRSRPFRINVVITPAVSYAHRRKLTLLLPDPLRRCRKRRRPIAAAPGQQRPGNARHGGNTVLAFAHRGFKQADDKYASANTRWGFYLLSLKRYLETGKGSPNPDDSDF